jgi:O-6-methylguanine DNA methyltransferase
VSVAPWRYGFDVARRVEYEVAGWGVGELWLEDELVVWHELPRLLPATPAASYESDTARRNGSTQDPSQTPAHPRGAGDGRRKGAGAGADFAPKVIRAIVRYFDGEIDALGEIPVDLEYETEFHARCARALRAVPPGQVVTYGELAALAGAPGAARAAGSFCARNRLGLFVPCHRVVGAAGLGSYGSLGLGYKRRLLALEGYGDAR